LATDKSGEILTFVTDTSLLEESLNLIAL